MAERGLNANQLARWSRQTYSNVHNIVKWGRLPERETMSALTEVLDPESNENLLFYRDVEELVRLNYDRRIAKAAVRLAEAEPEAAEAIARLCEYDPELAATVLTAAERFVDAGEPSRETFRRGFQELAERLGHQLADQRPVRSGSADSRGASPADAEAR